MGNQLSAHISIQLHRVKNIILRLPAHGERKRTGCLMGSRGGEATLAKNPLAAGGTLFNPP